MHVKLLAAAMAAFATTAHAQTLDLLTAYRQSSETSPLLAQMTERLHAEQAGKNIARSSLGPRLTAEGSSSFSDLELTGFGPQRINESYSPYSFVLSLNQPLINATAWSALQSSRENVQAREAELQSVRQHLMLQVAEAYFSILRAQAFERATLSQQTLLQEIADRAASEHRAGTGDIIAVEEAQARLDAAQARLLSARNQIELARRALERLTHQPAETLADLSSLEPQSPVAGSMEEWENTAVNNQPVLQKTRLEVAANFSQAKSADRRRWPTVFLNAQYNYADGSFAPDINRRESLVGISAVWPLFQAGEINATHARATALAQASQYGLEDLEDKVRLDTQQAYLDLQNSTAQLTAARQAFDSSGTALMATQKGHEVGSRTVAEVLDSAQRHAQAESDYYAALYNHVLARLRLKAAAGELSEQDMESVNALLTHSEATP